MSEMTYDEIVEMDGYLLRDAPLEDVEHYFVYNADFHAAELLEE